MHKTIKLTGGLLLALSLIVALALIYLATTFDANEYRDSLATRVKQETGRTLGLDNKISLQFYPWIGLRLGSVSLSGPASFGDEPFVVIRSASFKVKVLPLLQQRLEVDTILLDGLEVMLHTNKEGENNWDFGTKQEPSSAEPGVAAAETDGKSTLAGLRVNGVEITNASMEWRDAINNTHYDINKLSLQTNAIQLGHPVDIHLAATISGTSLPQSGIPLTLSARTTSSADGQSVNIENLQLQSDDLTLSGQLDATLNDAGPQFSGRLGIATLNPKSLLEKLEVALPSFADPQALQQLTADLSLVGNDKHVDVNELKIQLDDSTMNGQAHIDLSPALATEFTLALDRIDIDRYLPATETSSPGTESPATTNTGSTLDLPLDQLRALTIKGKLTLGELIVSGLHTNDITMSVAANKGLIQVNPLQAKLYQGSSNGQLQLDARGKSPRFSLTQRLQGFQTEPFVKDLLDKDLLSGRADMDLALDTTGNSVAELISHLNGSAQLSFKDGAIKGINVADEIRRAKARIEKQPVPKETVLQTDLTQLDATVLIKNGIAINDDLNAQAPYFRLGGSGSADLNQQTIDYLLKAKIVADGAGQGGEDLGSLHGATIPIRINGPLTAPEIKLDSAIIRDQLRIKAEAHVQERVEEKKEVIKEKIENKLKQKLKKLF